MKPGGQVPTGRELPRPTRASDSDDTRRVVARDDNRTSPVPGTRSSPDLRHRSSQPPSGNSPPSAIATGYEQRPKNRIPVSAGSRDPRSNRAGVVLVSPPLSDDADQILTAKFMVSPFRRSVRWQKRGSYRRDLRNRSPPGLSRNYRWWRGSTRWNCILHCNRWSTSMPSRTFSRLERPISRGEKSA